MDYPTNPLPTFADWRDRAAYLAAEYKIPISVTVLAVAIWATFAGPETPDPPDGTMAVVGSFALLSLPSFFVGKQIVEWLYDPNLVQVGVCIPGSEIVYRNVLVPPAIWAEKTVEDAAPLPVDEGWADYLVTDLEWLGDVEELTVRGLERSMMDPGEAAGAAEQVERYYRHYLSVRNEYAKLRATVGDVAQDSHDDALTSVMKTKSKTLAPGVDLMDVLDRAEDGDLDELADLDEIADPDHFENGEERSEPEP